MRILIAGATGAIGRPLVLCSRHARRKRPSQIGGPFFKTEPGLCGRFHIISIENPFRVLL
jgi:hypothetical protein